MCTPPPSRAFSEQGETVLAVQGGEIRQAVYKLQCGGVPIRKLPLGTSEEAKLERNLAARGWQWRKLQTHRRERWGLNGGGGWQVGQQGWGVEAGLPDPNPRVWGAVGCRR